MTLEPVGGPVLSPTTLFSLSLAVPHRSLAAHYPSWQQWCTQGEYQDTGTGMSWIRVQGRGLATGTGTGLATDTGTRSLGLGPGRAGPAMTRTSRTSQDGPNQPGRAKPDIRIWKSQIQLEVADLLRLGL